MMRKLLLIQLTLSLAFLLFPLHLLAAENPSFTLSISNSKPEVGKDKEIKVTVTGNKLQDLYAYEVNFVYDPSQLRLKEAKSGLTGFSVPVIVKENKIQYASTKIGNVAGESGDVILCTLTFEPIGKGEASIQLTDVKLVNSKLDTNKFNAGKQIKADIQNNQEVAAAFSDIAGHWASAAIERAAKLGLVNGYEDGTFRPRNLVTRAEFAVMLARTIPLSLEDVQELEFKDAQLVQQWARPSIAAAVKAGIVSGFADGTFRPDQLISRAEMTAMIVRALPIELNESAVLTFTDLEQIPVWARSYVATAVKERLIQGTGDNRFAPNDHATRAEAVTMLLAMHDFQK